MTKKPLFSKTMGDEIQPEDRLLSEVVPCFNEQVALPETHRRIDVTCSGLNIPYEIIYVNDGSTDKTWAIIMDLAKVNQRVSGVDLARNYGHQTALAAGLRQA